MIYHDALFVEDDPPGDRIMRIAQQLNAMCVAGEIVCQDPDSDRLIDRMVLELQSIGSGLRAQVLTLMPPTAAVWSVA